MAYQTGVSSNTQDLLHKFASFLADNGWEILLSQQDGTNWRLHFRLNAELVINLYGYVGQPTYTNRSDNKNSICGNISTGFNASRNYYNQPGCPSEGSSCSIGYTRALPSGAIIAYHFFLWENPKGGAIIIETTPNVFSYFFFGHIQKSSDYPGTGGYLNFQNNLYPDDYRRDAPWDKGSFYGIGFFHLTENFIRTLPGNADYDYSSTSYTGGDFVHEGYSPQCAVISSLESYYHRTINFNSLLSRGYNTMAGAPLLMPFYLWFVSWGNPYKYYSPSFMGYDTHKYFCTMQNLSPGTILSYGDKKYMCFPYNKVGDRGWALEYDG